MALCRAMGLLDRHRHPALGVDRVLPPAGTGLRTLAPAHDACLILDDNAHQYALDAHGLVPTVLDKQNVMAASWNNTAHYGSRAQQALAYGLLAGGSAR